MYFNVIYGYVWCFIVGSLLKCLKSGYFMYIDSVIGLIFSFKIYVSRIMDSFVFLFGGVYRCLYIII